MARLRDRSGKYPFNDWSGPLTDLDKFEEEIRELALQRFGVNQDGDCPVNLHIIDRTVFEPMHYEAVPYAHEAKTAADWDKIYRTAYSNMQIALEAFDRTIKHRRYAVEKQSKL